MKIAWSDAEKPDGVHLCGKVEMTETFDEASGVASMEPLLVDVKAVADAIELTLAGHVETLVKFRCVRCLELFSSRIQTSFQEVFCRTKLTAEQDEAEVIHWVDRDVPIDAYAIQAVLLAMPMNPLCKPDCLGLCPACGINHNEAHCSCNAESIDPRWDELANLFQSDRSSEISDKK
ncbi:YceD family protein [Ferroacidibacillus organovorans]|uniref:Metal-binding protein n=1 Tax=Ferroacidibacillus organovorans TaxID=1765683 RepID=A0A101XQC2_9BACL|nr:DUF177 domain-containing protein [Ferroacidibacillus organovorans]KUO95608.1 hypothetical protein ATW55_06960 [Ferroacidibacillus organovorans]